MPRGSMSKIPFNQVSLMSTILDIPFVCVKRVGIAMAQTKTCKSWLLPQRCGNFEKLATTAVPGGKKVAPPFFFYAPSLYVNTNRKTPVAYKIKSCHRVVATFGFRKNGLGFRKNHFGSVLYAPATCFGAKRGFSGCFLTMPIFDRKWGWKLIWGPRPIWGLRVPPDQTKGTSKYPGPIGARPYHFFPVNKPYIDLL